MTHLKQIDEIGASGLADIEAALSLEQLEAVRIHLLGKKGVFSGVLRGLGQLSEERRASEGAQANLWKERLQLAWEAKKHVLSEQVLKGVLQGSRIDLTAPARLPHRGSLHVVTQTIQKITTILARLGFDVLLGPEVETEYFNFDAVNIPRDHPSRDMQDTFFLEPGIVLRTHTSSVQMRAMRTEQWPLRILCPGAVYRVDLDATHSPMFHQIEGLWIDAEVRFSDLKGVLYFLMQELFGAKVPLRFRPSYFPFVEPGVEVDIGCFYCHKQTGECKVCKGSQWLEVLGAGMVHPRLFELAGGQPWRGFAFGIGVERIAMLLHQIPDLRFLFGGDMRFLKQFR